MSRYRPPQPPSTAYITPTGHTRLKKELDFLWRVKRPQITQAVSEAAAQGDRSENAEYIYGKKQLREIDRRVRYLRKRLDKLVIVNQLPSDTNKVYFGAWVLLEDDAGKETTYRIVGPDEFDLKQGLISMDAPLAKALLGKQRDDEVVVMTPEGERTYWVINIQYQSPDMVS